MQIEIFSDIACPWCYIGKRRFEAALETFPHADEVTVTYRSFQLDPTTPRRAEQSMTQMLATKLGRAETEAAAMNAQISEMAAGVGLEYNLDGAHPENTHDAHRLLHFAAAHGKQGELKERLLRAYFTDGAHIGDHDTLADLAAEIGLDRDTTHTVLAGDDYADDVSADLSLARGFGATGVPFFVFDRSYGVSGAQPTEVFTQTLETAWAATHPATTESQQHGDRLSR